MCAVQGDRHVVNCLEPHPYHTLLLATSGAAWECVYIPLKGCRFRGFAGNILLVYSTQWYEHAVDSPTCLLLQEWKGPVQMSACDSHWCLRGLHNVVGFGGYSGTHGNLLATPQLRSSQSVNQFG